MSGYLSKFDGKSQYGQTLSETLDILLPKVVNNINDTGSWRSLGWFKACWISHMLPFHDFSKSEQFCRSWPGKFDEKSKIVKLVGNDASILLPKLVTWWPTGYDIGRVDLKHSWSIDLQFRDFPKSEKFCMSGPVKFDEKSQNVKHFRKLEYPTRE